MNERTRFFIKKYNSHFFILERVNVGCEWDVSWRRGQTVTYWPNVLLTIAALLPHSGWAAQPWVTEGPSPLSGASSHSTGILSPTGTASRTDLSRLWHLVIFLLDDNLLPVGVRFCHHHWIQSRPQVKVIFRYLWPDAPVRLFFRLFTQVYLLIDGSVEGQYITIIPYSFFQNSTGGIFFHVHVHPHPHTFYK